MATDEDVAAGLLDWISSLEEVAEPIFTVDDLVAKDVLWRVLQSIDRFAFPGSLPEDNSQVDPSSRDSWVPRWNNLKHLYDALSVFLVEDCGQRLPIFHGSSAHRSNPDLKAVAQSSSLEDAIILLKLCVVAAANCADRIEYLQGMQRLGEVTQKVLMETLQEAQEAHEEDEDDGEDEDEDEDGEDEAAGYTTHVPAHRSPPRSPKSPRGTADMPAIGEITSSSVGAPGAVSELAFEERLAKVIADNQRIAHEKRDLQRNFDDFQARHDALVERHDRTQEELTEANDRLSAVLSGRGGEGGKEAKNEAVIANLEARNAEMDAEIEELRRNNEMLKIKADKAQKLQDDYDEIKIDRDRLGRKANAAEKYRIKLEQSQDLEKENTNLKSKVTELQAQLRQSDTRTASSSDLAREVDEYRRLLPSIEQERYEVNEMKKRIEFDYQVLQARHQESEEQLRRRAAEIEELQGRLRDYDDGFEPTPRDEHEVPANAKDLETEEADFAAAEARLTQALLKANASAELKASTNGDSKDKDKDTFESDNGISEDELRAIMSAMHAQMQAGNAQERESGMKVQKKLVIMLEKVRSKNIALVEHIKRQSELITDLRTQSNTLDSQLDQSDEVVPEEPKEPKSESELERQVDEQGQMIGNLKREIKLMTSAWYEQNQRLAALGSASGSGAVALMRMKAGSNGGDELRGFLGRQRRAMDRVVMGSASTSSVRAGAGREA